MESSLISPDNRVERNQVWFPRIMALNETLFGFLGNGFERNQFWIFSEVGAEWNQFRIFPMVGFERNLFWFSILPVLVWQRWRPAISWLRLEQPRWSARTGRPLYPPFTKSAFFKVTQEFFLQFSDCFFFIFPGVFSSYRIFLSSFRVFYHLSGSFYHLPVFIYHLSGSFFKTYSPRKWSECFVFYVNK